jgi:hypothetical protein
MKNWITYCFLLLLFSGCDVNEDPKLDSVEDRISAATKVLNDALIAPSNGWRLYYQPTNSSGRFLMLLDFRTDGTVRIQSDITANEGEFRDQIIPYRIDSSLGIELILETYGVFHYLFELRQSSFGAEFEFIFEDFEGDDLIFKSKTDAGDITQLRFEPALSSDESLISTESVQFLEQGIFQRHNMGSIGGFANYNLYLSANNHTLSFVLELDTRVALILGVSTGQDLPEIITNSSITSINQRLAYTYQSGAISFDEAIEFTHESVQYSINAIPLEDFELIDASFCDSQNYSQRTFSSTNAPNLGSFTMSSSLFQSRNNFQSDGLHSINHNFLYDQEDKPIADQVESILPNVVIFQWYQDYELSSDSTINAIGFVTVDELNNAEFFLRGFDYTQVGNYFEITFNGFDIYSDENTSEEKKNELNELTDTIFAGGAVYVMELLNIDGLYEFYNPCNGYKGFLL